MVAILALSYDIGIGNNLQHDTNKPGERAIQFRICLFLFDSTVNFSLADNNFIILIELSLPIESHFTAMWKPKEIKKEREKMKSPL